MQEASPAQSVHHSARSSTVSYLVANPHTITTYRHDLGSMNTDKSDIDKIGDYFELRKAEINQDYKDHSNNRNIKKGTKLYQEAVISFGREQFEQNNQADIINCLNKFCDNFEGKYGCKVLMSSLHLDEGHKDTNGNVLHNYHAHVLIENYSFTTHKTCLQKLDYRKLQTELARDFESLGFTRGQDYDKLQNEENTKAKLEGRLPEQIKPVRLEHKQYREMKEQEREQVKEVISPKNQIIADFKLQLDLANFELEKVNELYKQTREELKATNEATQADYQALKKLVDAQKLEITRHMELARQEHERFEKLQKEKEAEKSKHDVQVKDFQEKAEALKTELKSEKFHSDTLINENQELRAENTLLKTAIERFLDLPVIKGITSAAKTILERLNTVIEHISINAPVLENKDTNYKPNNKYILTNLKTGEQFGIDTNEDVLKHFEQYDQDSQIAKWREDGFIETKTQYHYLDTENPERVASVLNHEYKTDIKVEPVENLKSEPTEKAQLEIE